MSHVNHHHTVGKWTVSASRKQWETHGGKWAVLKILKYSILKCLIPSLLSSSCFCPCCLFHYSYIAQEGGE